MNINKTAFLLLAGAIATGACTTSSDSDDAGAGGAVGGSGGATGGTGGAVGGSGGATGGTGGSTGGTAGGADASVPDAAGSGGADASAPDGTAGGSGEGGSGGSACDDSVGTPPDCSQIVSECGWAVGYCTTLVADTKPKVGENIATCMVGLTECVTGNPYDCVKTGLAAACPDSTADDLCASAVTNCTNDPITAEDCHKMVDGLNETGRAAVQTCVVDDQCTYGLWSCIESL